MRVETNERAGERERERENERESENHDESVIALIGHKSPIVFVLSLPCFLPLSERDREGRAHHKCECEEKGRVRSSLSWCVNDELTVDPMYVVQGG